MYLTENLQEKWQVSPSEHPDLPKNRGLLQESVTTVILENQEKQFVKIDKSLYNGAALANSMNASSSTTQTDLLTSSIQC